MLAYVIFFVYLCSEFSRKGETKRIANRKL